MLTFVKQKTNDSGNRSEDTTVHHVQNTAHVINIGGTGGRGGIFIVGLILLRRIGTRCIYLIHEDLCRVWSKETSVVCVAG